MLTQANGQNQRERQSLSEDFSPNRFQVNICEATPWHGTDHGTDNAGQTEGAEANCEAHTQQQGSKGSQRRIWWLSVILPALAIAVLAQSGCVGMAGANGAPKKTGTTWGATNSANTNGPASSTNSNTSSNTSAPGNVAISPAALNFGNVSLGTSGKQSLTLSNAGSAAITVSQAAASGAGFAISGASVPFTLAAGQSTTLTVTFTPTTASSAAGSISITSGDAGSPAIVAAAGTGVAAIPSIASEPANQSVTTGHAATFSVTATGTAPLGYQWEKNGAVISGAKSASYTTPNTVTADNGSQFSVVVSNSAGSVGSNAAILTVTSTSVAPSIGSQPASHTVTAGQTATFAVTASGTAPLSYQWKKNGAAIGGATSASYTTPAAASSDNGAQFSVVVSNSVTSVTSNAATLTVNAAATAPSVTSEPASRTVTAGQTATFAVTASGTAPLDYQWKKNGTAISGATSASYTTPVTATTDSGSQFIVTVSNAAGSATSNTAVLTVNPAPVAPSIASQPVSSTVTAGQTATFTVTASGTAPLSYQWRKNGAAIAAATLPSYTTPATTSADNGAQFSVVVGNSVSAVTSSAATLTVSAASAPLTASTSALNFGNVTVGTSGKLSVTLTNSSTSAITVSGVTVSGAGVSASGVSAGLSIPAGQSATLNVIFAPAAAGTLTGGSVSVASSATNSPAAIAVSGAGVQATAHSVSLTWTAESGVAGYNVYRTTTSGSSYVQVNPSQVAGAQYTDSTVQGGTTYYYVVTALNSSSVESAYSNEVTAAIPAP